MCSILSRDVVKYTPSVRSILPELANGRLKIENRTNESWFFAVKSKKEKKFVNLFLRESMVCKSYVYINPLAYMINKINPEAGFI